MTHIIETEFWDKLMDGVYGPRKGGARIIIDAEDAETGVAKTSGAVALARLLSRKFGYELEKDDFTLSGKEYLERWREHPDKEQPSVIVLDELSGAGAGDARRAMSNQNVNLGRSWQLMRKKRIVTITTLPHWTDAESRMRRFANFRLNCKKRPIGTFVPYQVGAGFDDGGIRTYTIDDGRRIQFPNMDAESDPYYQHISQRKDDLLESEYFDADELTEGGDAEEPDPDEARREQKIEIAQTLREQGMTTREVADSVDMSKSWVVSYTDNPGGEA